ncbi:MAG: outer membrane beta-barrel protein [Chlorobiales bacterium]|nr:outer membrane beta-barrel protein [Chlorobiales bacterium]
MLSIPTYAADTYHINEYIDESSISDVKTNISTLQTQQETVPETSAIDLTSAFVKGFDNFRLEAEIVYQKNDADKIIINSGIFSFKGDDSVTSYMANGFYDSKCSVFNLYLMAGIGLAQASIHNKVNPPNTISETYSGLCYQFGAGITVPVALNLFLDLRYRYFGTYQLKLDNDNGNYKVPGNKVFLGFKVGL